MKSLKENQRIENKFSHIHNVIDDLPTKVLKCESMCRNSEETVY